MSVKTEQSPINRKTGELQNSGLKLRPLPSGVVEHTLIPKTVCGGIVERRTVRSCLPMPTMPVLKSGMLPPRHTGSQAIPEKPGAHRKR